MNRGKDALIILGTFLVLGLVGGVVWWLLVDPAVYTKVSQGGTMAEQETGKRFDMDGWYSVVAAVLGAFAGTALTWWRVSDAVLTTLLVAVGAGLAAAVMSTTGQLLGPGDADVALAAAEVGETVPVELSVTAAAAYLVWPIAALAGALMVLWSQPTPSGEDREGSAGGRSRDWPPA